MIRTIAAVAALAALPAIAMAQPSRYAASDRGGTVVVSDEVTVQGQHPDRYSILINVAGKPQSLVRREIQDAAYTACRRAPLTGNRADLTVEAMSTCVTQAEWMATVQYDSILDGRRLRLADYSSNDY